MDATLPFPNSTKKLAGQTSFPVPHCPSAIPLPGCCSFLKLNTKNILDKAKAFLAEAFLAKCLVYCTRGCSGNSVSPSHLPVWIPACRMTNFKDLGGGGCFDYTAFFCQLGALVTTFLCEAAEHCFCSLLLMPFPLLLFNSDIKTLCTEAGDNM